MRYEDFTKEETDDLYFTSVLLGLDAILSETNKAKKKIFGMRDIEQSEGKNETIRKALNDVKRNVDWVLYDS